MLHVDPTERIKAPEILNHKWIKMRDNLPQMKLPHADVNVVQTQMSLVFNAIQNPAPIILNPVKNSSLAQRRAAAAVRDIIDRLSVD